MSGPGIEPGTSGLWVRRATNCAMQRDLKMNRYTTMFRVLLLKVKLCSKGSKFLPLELTLLERVEKMKRPETTIVFTI